MRLFALHPIGTTHALDIVGHTTALFHDLSAGSRDNSRLGSGLLRVTGTGSTGSHLGVLVLLLSTGLAGGLSNGLSVLLLLTEGINLRSIKNAGLRKLLTYL